MISSVKTQDQKGTKKYRINEISHILDQTKKQSIQDYQVLGQLGRGAYGEVVLARNTLNMTVAIKKIDQNFMEKNQRMHEVFIEKEVLQMLDHPGVIKLKSSFRDKYKFYFVLEFAEGGSFSEYIRLYSIFIIVLQYSKIRKQTKVFYYSVLSSLAYVDTGISSFIRYNPQRYQVILLQPENIMLSKDRHLKLIDFATATVYDESLIPTQKLERFAEIRSKFKPDELTKERLSEEQPSERNRLSSFVGTNEYISPELLNESICTPASDLWAFGCVCYKLFSGQTPFYANNEKQIYDNISLNPVSFNKSFPDSAQNLIESILLKEPNKRLGVLPNGQIDYSIIRKHKFFEGLELDSIFTCEAPEEEIITPIKISKIQLQNIEENKIPLQEVTYDAYIEGQVDKFPDSFWGNIFSVRERLLKLIQDDKKAIIKYQNLKSGVERTIPVNRQLHCQLISQDTFQINQQDKRLLFKAKNLPTATTWVQKINQAIQRTDIENIQ